MKKRYIVPITKFAEMKSKEILNVTSLNNCGTDAQALSNERGSYDDDNEDLW